MWMDRNDGLFLYRCRNSTSSRGSGTDALLRPLLPRPLLLLPLLPLVLASLPLAPLLLASLLLPLLLLLLPRPPRSPSNVSQRVALLMIDRPLNTRPSANRTPVARLPPLLLLLLLLAVSSSVMISLTLALYTTWLPQSTMPGDSDEGFATAAA